MRTVRGQELFTYDTYPVEFAMREVFGFGTPMDHTPIMASNGRDTIIVEHVNQLKMDLAPHWPSAPRDGTYA